MEDVKKVYKEQFDELYDSKEKLGYFKIFLRKEDYDKVIEMGEGQDKVRSIKK